jgi:hypothetical protein
MDPVIGTKRCLGMLVCMCLILPTSVAGYRLEYAELNGAAEAC